MLHAAAAYEKARIGLTLGETVDRINRSRNSVSLASGEEIPYDTLVLAVGSRPRIIPLQNTDLQGVYYLRNADDVDCIRRAAKRGGHAVIVGGGYIGLEVAASLRVLGMEVTVLEALERVLQRVTCPHISKFFTEVHREEGVNIRTQVSARAILGDRSVSGIELDSGDVIDADLIVIGIGVEPNTDLATDANLAISNGIATNQYAQSSDPNIYAVGDCASFFHPRYKRQIRLESVQNANDQGVAAAKAITGRPDRYEPIPWFWSDQYDLKLQIAGLSTDADDVIIRYDEQKPRSMSVLHLRDGKLLAVDAINRPRDFVHGKKLILEGSVLDLDRIANSDHPLTDAVA